MKFFKVFSVSLVVAGFLAGQDGNTARAAQADLYDACRKAMGVHRIFRAYINSKGRLICYIADIESGSITNGRRPRSQNFNSQFNTHKKRKRQ